MRSTSKYRLGYNTKMNIRYTNTFGIGPHVKRVTETGTTAQGGVERMERAALLDISEGFV
jgi:hypothetical protein